MEGDLQTSWTAVDTGKGSGRFARRPVCCQNVRHVLPYFLQFFEMNPGMPSDRGFLAGCPSESVQYAVQLEIQEKERPFVKIMHLHYQINHIEN